VTFSTGNLTQKIQATLEIIEECTFWNETGKPLRKQGMTYQSLPSAIIHKP
jgi:hypothetical protein